MTTIPPATPKKSEQQIEAQELINFKIREKVESLNRQWSMSLELPGQVSPAKRPRDPKSQCVHNIRTLCYRNAIDLAHSKFDKEASRLYGEWLKLPTKVRGDLPDPDSLRPITFKEQAELLQRFIAITSNEVQRLMKEEARTPLSSRLAKSIDDSPIPLQLNVSSHVHGRPSDKMADTFRQSRSLGGRSDDISPPSKRNLETENHGTGDFHKRPKLPQSEPSGQDRSRSVSRAQQLSVGNSRSGITSFESDQTSVFDTASISKESVATQDTVPDEDPNNNQSSQFGSSFDPELAQILVDDVAKSFSFSSEEKLRDSLRNVFPDATGWPPAFFATPLHVRYEILRIFLHLDVPLSQLKLPLRRQDWSDYDNLWSRLMKLPALAGKKFPEKVSKETWQACQTEFRKESDGVNMAGHLQYTKPGTDRLFKFSLAPLRLERTHRLSRRFGCDRFLEISIPNLTGRQAHETLRSCPNGKTIVVEWLTQSHLIIGRMWSVFCSKKLDQIEVKKGIDQTFTNRIFFFATDGNEFQKSIGTPKENQGVSSRSAWTVEGLFNWIRPTWENKHQPALKLYARTELAVSRNISTVVLNNSQIRQKRDLYWPRKAPGGQCMTDGGGRMSQSLALKITQKLGLSYLPCAFQGRLGGAKGLWVIDISDLGTEDWIEVYGEQLKWVRNGKIDDRDYNDPAHRTFEVVKYSGPHGPSSLNLQLLPILVNGALFKPAMRDAISGLLRDSLVKKMKEERAAMDDAQVFRKWIRDSSNPVVDRVKNGIVPYKAAMPVALGEKINMFLDAGFEPLKLDYLQTLARQAYEQHCKDLEDKMHIPVERSTYAFMAPDWTETLEEGEAFFHPSECFVDALSLSAGLPLQGDILVARLPAHFPSDIQKVKAVVRTELMGLKDVVVFSTKGSCLADKLSGGDYDGDQAWICWEPTLVGNFENSKVPKLPNLVEEGLIIKDSTKFESLVRNEKDPTQKFLNYSLEFALEQRMVGICTAYKEKWTYTHKTIRSRDAVRLSKLLSDLVDQAKQGYKFTEKEFEAFKGTLADSSFRMPIYMTKAGGNKMIPGAGETHIIDHLTYVVHETIQKSMEEFHNSFRQIPKVDEDLTAFHKHVMEEAAVSDEWLAIMKKLISDLEEAKERWRVNNDHKCEDDKPEFGPILEDSYDHYLSIQPDQDTPLTKVLLGPWIGHAEFTQWALLRASTLVASYYSRGYKLPKFVWWMAGKQLCHLKSLRSGGAVTIAPHMYAMLRPDNTFVKLRSSEAAMELALGELEEEDELAAGSGVDVMMLTSTVNGSTF